MKKQMIIMRGLPGSGKSTIAYQIVAHGGEVCSSDHYMYEGDEYVYRPEKLAETHRHCQNAALEACRQGISPVVIDNCNATKRDMNPYLEIARRFGYEVSYRQPETAWARDPAECAKRNSHNVPEKAIQKVFARWEE